MRAAFKASRRYQRGSVSPSLSAANVARIAASTLARSSRAAASSSANRATSAARAAQSASAAPTVRQAAARVGVADAKPATMSRAIELRATTSGMFMWASPLSTGGGVTGAAPTGRPRRARG